MFSILLVLGAVATSFSASKVLLNGATILVPAELWKKNKEHKRNLKLGINPEFDKYKVAFVAERMAKGLPPPEEEGYELFEFQPGTLPQSMSWLEKQRWIVTEYELIRLLAMARRHMLDLREGFYAEEFEKVCIQYNIPYDELAKLAALLSTKMGYQEKGPFGQNEEGPLCYQKLIWLSNNRLEDPVFQQILPKNG